MPPLLRVAPALGLSPHHPARSGSGPRIPQRRIYGGPPRLKDNLSHGPALIILERGRGDPQELQSLDPPPLPLWISIPGARNSSPGGCGPGSRRGNSAHCLFSRATGLQGSAEMCTCDSPHHSESGRCAWRARRHLTRSRGPIKREGFGKAKARLPCAPGSSGKGNGRGTGGNEG